jgi:hypothetical protein
LWNQYSPLRNNKDQLHAIILEIFLTFPFYPAQSLTIAGEGAVEEAAEVSGAVLTMGLEKVNCSLGGLVAAGAPVGVVLAAADHSWLAGGGAGLEGAGGAGVEVHRGLERPPSLKPPGML